MKSLQRDVNLLVTTSRCVYPYLLYQGTTSNVSTAASDHLAPEYMPTSYGAYPPLGEKEAEGGKPETYLWLSIIVCCCCNPLLGVWAIGYSGQ